MNLAIVGYGKMGRLIEQLAPEFGFDVVLRLDVDNNSKFQGLTAENFRGVDAAVEFSTPSAAVENIERLSRLGVNVVIGTTGWFGEIARAKAANRLAARTLFDKGGHELFAHGARLAAFVDDQDRRASIRPHRQSPTRRGRYSRHHRRAAVRRIGNAIGLTKQFR